MCTLLGGQVGPRLARLGAGRIEQRADLVRVPVRLHELVARGPVCGPLHGELVLHALQPRAQALQGILRLVEL